LELHACLPLPTCSEWVQLLPRDGAISTAMMHMNSKFVVYFAV
jgi:hypothetical protein